MLDTSLADSLFPSDLPEVSDLLALYPPRDLPPGAHVTRVAPSPTGHLHIGGIYAAMISKDLAIHSGGTYFVRIEDTDQTREIPGAVEQFSRAFTYFGLAPDEDGTTGRYGPYTQSARAVMYLSFVRDLLRKGHAYLCFATKEELKELASTQKTARVPTGYYGPWAPWRDAPAAAITHALDAGKPYVVRFRSPGIAGSRTSFTDAIRGRIELDDNINDAVILKSSDSPLPLPTYHLAHIADEWLMRVTVVLRGEEWLPSVPLHRQIAAAIGAPPVTYAHIAHLLKLDGRSKRKLSKRHDPEASVDFYLQAGYPAGAVLYYLRGLANGRLASLPATQALAQPIHLGGCGGSGALADLIKLDDICADYIAAMPSTDVLAHVAQWAAAHDPGLAEAIAAHQDRALAALAIEREGTTSPRKDLRRWNQYREIYGYFLPPLFTAPSTLEGTGLDWLDPHVVKAFAADLATNYSSTADPESWFGQIRAAAARHGFAPDAKQYKANPEAFPGSVREAAQTVRVALTGSTRSPDLHSVAMALGSAEVIKRIDALGT